MRTFPHEQLCRDGVGAVLSEDDTKSETRPIRAALEQTPRGACRVLFGGALQALGDDGERLRRTGPVN